MIHREDVYFDDVLVKAFEEMVEMTYIDWNTATEKKFSGTTWEYKHDQIEQEFLIFLRTLYTICHPLNTRYSKFKIGPDKDHCWKISINIDTSHDEKPKTIKQECRHRYPPDIPGVSPNCIECGEPWKSRSAF